MQVTLRSICLMKSKDMNKKNNVQIRPINSTRVQVMVGGLVISAGF